MGRDDMCKPTWHDRLRLVGSRYPDESVAHDKGKRYFQIKKPAEDPVGFFMLAL